MSRPTSLRLARALTALVVAPALGLVAAPAMAQTGALDSLREGSSGPDGSVAGSVDSMGSLSPDSLSQVLGSSGMPLFAGSTALGSANFAGFHPDLFAGEPAALPAPDPSITTTEVLRKKKEDGRYEQWEIAYAPMQRVITVEIYRAPGGGAAPNLYLLDGVGSPLQSGFTQWNVGETFKNENVNLVIPTRGVGAMWADWNKVDPALGVNKWETFLTEDLPALLAGPKINLPTNGKSGVGGVSMGASAAVTLAAKHPEMYAAAFGISGCYQTDGLGQILADYTVSSRGGDIENMWGPVGGAQWKENDATVLAEKLKGKKIYFSSATGAATNGELEEYDYDIVHFTEGAALEQAVNSCSGSFSRRLDQLGIEHTWDQVPQGMHNWWNFNKQLPVAWNSVKSALA